MGNYYMVKNITINNNKEYTTKIPTKYLESEWFAKVYLRTELFSKLDITFDYAIGTKFIEKGFRTIEHLERQPYDTNIYDARTAGLKEYDDCDDYTNIDVFLMYWSQLVVYLTDDDIQQAANSVKLAIIEKLTYLLPIDLCYSTSKIENNIVDELLTKVDVTYIQQLDLTIMYDYRFDEDKPLKMISYYHGEPNIDDTKTYIKLYVENDYKFYQGN